MIDKSLGLALGRRGQWITVAAAIAIGIGIGFVLTVIRPYSYESETTIYVSAQTAGGDPSAAYNGTLLSQEKVKSYVELLTDSRLTQDVAQRLGDGRDAAGVAEHLSASSPSETAIIRLVATDASPATAQALATAGADSMLQLIADIERPIDPGQEPPVVARIVRPATISVDPVSPVPALDVSAGALIGLLVGLALVALRHTLDRSLRTPAALAATVDARVLGSVPRDPGFAGHPLAVRDDRHSLIAEAFRQIRTNLLLIDTEHTSQVLLVTSARPLEGTSTVAGNLALALASTGRRVLLVVADLRQPSVEQYFALEDDGPGLVEVLAGRVAVDVAIRRVDGLDLLPAGARPSNPGEILASERTAVLLSELRRRYDQVIVDVPPVLPFADAAAVSAHVDASILVARYGRTAAEDVETAGQALRVGSTPVVGAVLTMTPGLRRQPRSRGPEAAPDHARPDPEQAETAPADETDTPSDLVRAPDAAGTPTT